MYFQLLVTFNNVHLFAFHSPFQLPTVKAKEQTKENTEEGCADDAGTLPSAVAGSFQEGSLVLCNPGASSVLDPDSDSQDQTQKPPPSPLGVRLRTAVSQGFPSKPCYRAHTLPIDPDKLRPDSRFSEVSNSSPDTEASEYDTHLNDSFTEMSKATTCMECLGT